MLKRFKFFQSGFREVDEVQRNLKEKFAEFDAKEILDGFIIKDVSVSTSDIQLAHKLGRKYVGFIVIDNQDGLLMRNTRTAQDNQYITIRTTAGSGKISIWVF